MHKGAFTVHEVALSMLRPGSTVLDVGCGTGRFAEMARSISCQVTGVEISAEGIESMVNAEIESNLVDLEKEDSLDFLDGQTYDHVAVLGVLEHVRHPDEVLARIMKLLAPSGELILSIPIVTNPDARLDLLNGTLSFTDEGVLDRTHLGGFERSSAVKLVQDVGLEIIDLVEVRHGAGDTQATEFPRGVVKVEPRPADDQVQYWVMLLSNDVHPLRQTIVRRTLVESMERAQVIEEATVYARRLEATIAELEEKLEDALLLQREVESQNEVIRRLSNRIVDTERHWPFLESQVKGLESANAELMANQDRLFFRLGDRLARALHGIGVFRMARRSLKRMKRSPRHTSTPDTR